MHYGIIDLEMTCDGKLDNGRFIDDGRMSFFKREIISVGFIVCDDSYNIKNKYYSVIKPLSNTELTDYCVKFTGITQEQISKGKRCNNAFGDIIKM